MKADQACAAERFRALHVRGSPLVLFNVWDAGSAAAVAAAGAKAVGTSSWSVAAAHGYADGERLPFELALANLGRITRATDLPVTVDLEGGYGETPAAVGETIRLVIDAGAIGCNIEDSCPADGRVRAVADQCERIRSARRAADGCGMPFFINARTDAPVTEVIERGHAYANAGADGLFVPALSDIRMIAGIAEQSALPLNIMVTDGSTAVDVLAGCGVARVSYGPAPYLLAMRALQDAARSVLCAS